jgi:sirohydrochlorin cobaltochelatase
VILVGHGIPAKDYPEDRLREFFRMELSHHSGDGGHDHGHGHAHEDHDHSAGEDPAARWTHLDREIREWPRTVENDPYKFAVDAIAERLERASGHQVLVAFNEFCAPTIEEAIERAIADGADRVIVLSIMLTPGGGHSDYDIPRSIERAQRRYPDTEIVYAWPYEIDLIARMLSTQVKSFEAR